MCSSDLAIRRLLEDFTQGRTVRVLQALPLWVVTVALSMIVGIVAVVGGLLDGAAASVTLHVSFFLFFFRDAALVMFLNLGRRPERADAAALLYLVILYGLIPAIIASGFGLNPEGFLYPSDDESVLVGVLPSAVQALAAWTLTIHRWRSRWREPDLAP